MSKPPKIVSDLAKARLERVKGGGVNGAQASSIGLTLAGCIIVSVLAGLWLDKRFSTQYWTPILFLVGVAAGFRQMLCTVRDTNAYEARRRKTERAKQAERATDNASSETNISTESGRGTDATPQRTRVFQVPSPPFASFESGVQQEGKKAHEYSQEKNTSKDDFGLRVALDELKHDGLNQNDETHDDAVTSPKN